MVKLSLLVQLLLLHLALTTDARPGKKKSELTKGSPLPRMKSIQLFPKARSWCRAQDITQIVDHEGCTEKKIRNKFCIGQCFSYASPDVLPSGSGIRLNYCDSCQPTKTNWIKVNLDCPNHAKGVDKLVEIILECKCKDCRRNYRWTKWGLGWHNPQGCIIKHSIQLWLQCCIYI